MRVSRPGRGRLRGTLPRRRPCVRAPLQHRTQRRQRVVGDLAGPHQVPQGGERLAFGGAGCGRAHLAPEAGAALGQLQADGIVQLRRSGGSGCSIAGASSGSWSTKYSRTRPSVAPIEPAPTQTSSPRRAQLVEVGRPVATHPQRQHVGLERAGDQRRALQHADRLDERFEPAPFAGHVVPRREEPRRSASPRRARPRGAARPTNGDAAGGARRRRTTRG